MEEYSFDVSPFPVFGSWNNITYDTTAFAEEPMYSCYDEDRDLYVVGDLYDNDVTTPTVIAVPWRQRKEVYTKENKWMGSCELKAPPSPVPAYLLTPPPPPPVEEDLYKVSPGIISAEDKKRGKEFLFKVPAT
ncbi:hypothetical protein OROMI_011136 [Orobanche minor]